MPGTGYWAGAMNSVHLGARTLPGEATWTIGAEFMRYFIELGELQPDEKALDVGCGIGRVLKDGGRCLGTFFLQDEEARQCIREGKSILNFAHDFRVYSSIHARRPEAAVCYEEAFVLDLYRKSGLQARQPIYHGAWSGRPNYLSSQDIIIAAKGQVPAPICLRPCPVLQ